MARTACTIQLAISVAALIGWHAHIPVLTAVPTSATPMWYNTALALALLAVAIGALVRDRRALATVASAAAFSIGSLTLAQFVFGVDFGIDELFFTGYSHASRMSPNASLGITLGGAALLLMSRARSQTAGAIAGSVGGVIVGVGVTAAFGYLVDFPTTYSWGGLVALSPNAAVALICGGVGILAVAWRGSSRATSVPEWLPIPLGLLVLTIGVVLYQAIIAVLRTPAEFEGLERLLPAGALAFTLALAAALSASTYLFIHERTRTRELALAEAEARRQQAIARNVIDVMPVGVFVADESGHITMANRAGQEIWGGVRHVGAPEYGEYKGWWAGTDRRLAAEDWALARALRGASVRDEIVDIEAFDGTRKTVMNSACPVNDGASRMGAVVAVQDVTERRRMELALTERTRELERSNADLEQFAYVASHDLREPLRMVASFTELLARRYSGRLDAAADEYIGFVVDGAKRMQRLLDGLLDYSRIGTHGQAQAAVDTTEVVRDALANLKLTIEEAGATIEVGDLPMVWGDRAQLTQVVQNLVSNSLKFRREDGPVRIRISAVTEGRECTFSVEDNGIGIDPRHADVVFTIFYRLDRSGRYSGTGLGLAICKRIVERHGGRIWVEPSTGSGTTLRFTLHRAPASERALTPLLERTA